MTRAVLYLWPAGCDAVGAIAARRPQDEAGGGHGSGLRERDHDPDALPPERDHHLHLQTGTAGPACSVLDFFFFPLVRPAALDSAAVLQSTRRWRWELAMMTEGSLILLG